MIKEVAIFKQGVNYTKMSSKLEKDTILVIETDIDVGEFICSHLENIGKSVFCVHSASQAYEWLEKQTPELILLDYLLSDSNAVVFMEQLKQMNKKIPVIVITGMQDEKIVVEVMNRGARDYLIKDNRFFNILIESVKRVFNEINTENKLQDTQKALKDSQELLAISQRLAKVGSWIYDPFMQKTVWSREMFNIYGLNFEEGVPDFSKLAKMVYSEDMLSWKKMIEDVTKYGEFRELEFRILRTDGQCRWVNAQEGADRDPDGSICSFYGTIMDITERKQKEACVTRISVLDKASSEFNTAEILKEQINELTKRISQNTTEFSFAFAKAIYLKDPYTGKHVEKTVQYAEAIGKELGLSKNDMERIKQAAMLHDLGKIGISENILQKPSALSEKEYCEIKRHPQIGIEILSNIQYFYEVIPLIFYHHEHWDGKGYPTGIKGEEIPMGARVVAIADVFDALTSDRPYRKAYSAQEALEIISQESGTKFDPQVVNAFVKVYSENSAFERVSA